MIESILKKSALGSFYYIAVSAITLILGFVRVVLLMRLLGVDSFGTIALAFAFSKFILPLSTMGLDHALLQKKTPTSDAYSTHFILRVGLSLLIGFVCLGISPLLRIVYEAQLVKVFLILLTINIFDSTYSTHFVILRREMRFGALAIVNLFASIFMTILTPIAAFLGAGVWSLVIEQALGTLIRWVGGWIILRPWKLKFLFSRTEARSQISFGLQVVTGNLLGTILDRFDDFWIGTSLGITSLGHYSRAYELTQYPERILSSPITTVFMSAYASIQDKRQDLSRLFFHSSSFLIRAGFLVSSIMLITAPELVTLIFTPRWLPVVPIFRLMTIYIMLDPIYINLSTMLVGIGNPRLLNRVRVIQVAVFIPAVILMSEAWGTNGVAIAANLMMLSGVVLLLAASRKIIQVSLMRLWFYPSIAAILACTISIFASSSFSINLVGLFVIKTGLVFITYLALLLILEYKDIRHFGFASIKYVTQYLKLSRSK